MVSVSKRGVVSVELRELRSSAIRTVKSKLFLDLAFFPVMFITRPPLFPLL